MKIIDLLNAKYKGIIKEGLRFVYDNSVYEYEDDSLNNKRFTGTLGSNFKLENILDKEIEILTPNLIDTDYVSLEEEFEEIRPIEVAGCNFKTLDTWMPTESMLNDILISKINKLIDQNKQIINKLTKE